MCEYIISYIYTVCVMMCDVHIPNSETSLGVNLRTHTLG